MRVIAGKCRSLPLKTLEGLETRPTTDRTKETLFNVLQPWIPGCRFLDLFSGSGGIGIEALSRGAVKAVFVEQSRKAVTVIRENLQFTKLLPEAVIMQDSVMHALSILSGKGEVFDCIFMDPPYGLSMEENVFQALAAQKYVTENTMIIVEAMLDRDFAFLDELGFEVTREKLYKTNKHVFCRKVR